MKKEAYDHLDRRCPRLGGPVTFGYCRTSGKKKGCCFKIADCWWEYFDVTAYLRAVLPPEKFDEIMCLQAAPKITSLIEMINNAKKK